MIETEVTLPKIRQDLEISKGGTQKSGARYLLIHDRLQNAYFRISDRYIALLHLWEPVSVEAMLARVNRDGEQSFTQDDINIVAEFLFANSLTVTAPSGDYKGYWDRALAGKKSWWVKLIHNYLFFRIPLTRPQKFLDITWPVVSFLFTFRATVIFTLIALAGVYLVSRQWSQFLSTFASFLTVEGFALYALSLVLIKSLHEMGHAFMAKKYGVDVPVIGAAFIVMMPILYTDTTGAWRLSDRNKRLMIDAAGIFTELAIAALCTLLWVFLPDGNLRAIAFTTATLSWALSLTINLNPFMKFDGYYLLSDWLEFENLQDRGFKLAKWWIRELLFDLRIPSPEKLTRKMQGFIIAHAIGVWIYRFFLFLGIALIVYHFFFKVLGIFLFVIELFWFIAMPIWREIKEWINLKNEIMKRRRILLSLTGMAILIIGLAVPWSRTVTMPAILMQANENTLHLPFPAKLVNIQMKENMYVETGQLLLQFSSDAINQEISEAKFRQNIIAAKLARAHVDSEDRSVLQILTKQSAAINDELKGLHTKIAELNIRAPHTGKLVDVNNNLHPQLWLNETQQLAIIRSTDASEIKALVDAKSHRRIAENNRGVFVPDNIQLPTFEVVARTVSTVTGAGQELNYLSEESGSSIPTLQGKDGKPTPKGAWFSVRLEPLDMPFAPDSIIRGKVVLDAERESLMSQIFRQVVSVFVREAGI